MMAGGHLEAVFDDGGVHASFKLGCDTLIARQPYHYDIAACVDIRGSNTFDLIGTHTISIDLGADRHISGPGVAGIATAHRYLCSFDIAFGPTSRPDPVETSWQACEQSCLPKPDAGLAVAFVDGVLAQRTDDDGGDCRDPTGGAAAGDGECHSAPGRSASAARPTTWPIPGSRRTTARRSSLMTLPLPIALSGGAFESKLEVAIRGKPTGSVYDHDAIDHFTLVPRVKQSPRALWAKKLLPTSC